MDDIYATCEPERVVPVFQAFEAALRDYAGISLNTAKTRVWNESGVPPPNVQQLGDDAWSSEGVVILGTPVGSSVFVEGKLQERVDKAQAFLDEVALLDDPHKAWQILVRCAVPRANHTQRTLDPTHARTFARQWNTAIWTTARKILGAEEFNVETERRGLKIAWLPCRLGGLRLGCAERASAAAF